MTNGHFGLNLNDVCPGGCDQNCAHAFFAINGYQEEKYQHSCNSMNSQDFSQQNESMTSYFPSEMSANHCYYTSNSVQEQKWIPSTGGHTDYNTMAVANQHYNYAPMTGYQTNDWPVSDYSVSCENNQVVNNAVPSVFPTPTPPYNLPEIHNLMSTIKDEKPQQAAAFYEHRPQMSPVEKMPLEPHFHQFEYSTPPHFLTPISTSSNTLSAEGATYNSLCDYSVTTLHQYPPVPYYEQPIQMQAPLYPPQPVYLTEMYSHVSPKLETSPPPQDPLVKPTTKKRIQAVSCHSNSVCANCHTRETTLWRRNIKGDIECNACNLYYRKNSRKRPMSLKKETIMKRNRKPRCDSPYRP